MGSGQGDDDMNFTANNGTGQDVTGQSLKGNMTVQGDVCNQATYNNIQVTVINLEPGFERAYPGENIFDICKRVAANPKSSLHVISIDNLPPGDQEACVDLVNDNRDAGPAPAPKEIVKEKGTATFCRQWIYQELGDLLTRLQEDAEDVETVCLRHVHIVTNTEKKLILKKLKRYIIDLSPTCSTILHSSFLTRLLFFLEEINSALQDIWQSGLFFDLSIVGRRKCKICPAEGLLVLADLEYLMVDKFLETLSSHSDQNPQIDDPVQSTAAPSTTPSAKQCKVDHDHTKTMTSGLKSLAVDSLKFSIHNVPRDITRLHLRNLKIRDLVLSDALNFSQHLAGFAHLEELTIEFSNWWRLDMRDLSKLRKLERVSVRSAKVYCSKGATFRLNDSVTLVQFYQCQLMDPIHNLTGNFVGREYEMIFIQRGPKPLKLFFHKWHEDSPIQTYARSAFTLPWIS